MVVEFGAFIVLCGLTHLTNVWTFTSSSADAVITMTLFKVSTAFVSCATAVTLSWVIPEVLSVKKRELFLAVKVCSSIVQRNVPCADKSLRLSCRGVQARFTGAKSCIAVLGVFPRLQSWISRWEQ